MLRVLSIMSMVFLGGCHLLFPFEAVQDVDAGPEPDLGLVDLERLGDLDHPSLDGPSDLPWPLDATPIDAPALNDFTGKLADAMKPTDKKVVPVDGQPKQLDIPITALDAQKPLPKACATGTKVTYSNGAQTMAVCTDTAASSHSQCDAYKLCNLAGGWGLCTAQHYLTRGGKSKGWPGYAWLQSCVRAKGKLSTPSNGLCDTKCTSQPASGMFTAWTCNGMSPQFSLGWSEVGVVTHTLCFRVGNVNTSGYAAFWAPRATSMQQVSAVCCTP